MRIDKKLWLIASILTISIIYVIWDDFAFLFPFSSNSDNYETSQVNFCAKQDPKLKFYLAKNIKCASTTLAGIFTQIATHYHKYEIVTKDDVDYRDWKKNRNANGYFLQHHILRSDHFQKLFPKKDVIWVSSAREPTSQVLSYIKFKHLEKQFTPEAFNYTYKNTKSKKPIKKGRAVFFKNKGSKIILGDECLDLDFGEKFKKCTKKIMDLFDVIIPVEKLNQGLVVLHKMSCLPLSDFAYIKKKESKNDFQLSPQNLSVLMEYQKADQYFYEESVKKFDEFFHEFQRSFCSSYNCELEVSLLEEQNEKLKKECGLVRIDSIDGKHESYTYDWEKLENDYPLAMRCMSFLFDHEYHWLYKIHNKHVPQKKQDKYYEKVAPIWLKEFKEAEGFF